MLLRRFLVAILLLIGFGLCAWSYVRFDVDPRRALVVGGVALISLLLNAISWTRRTFALRGWLRVVAASVSICVLLAIGASWLINRETLADLPRGETALRDALRLSLAHLPWVAVSLVYLIVSLVTLPPTPTEEP